MACGAHQFTVNVVRQNQYVQLQSVHSLRDASAFARAPLHVRRNVGASPALANEPEEGADVVNAGVVIHHGTPKSIWRGVLIR